MSDELAQLDELIESDILEALGQEVPEELKNTEKITTMEIVEPDELTNIPEGLLDPVEVTKEVEISEDNNSQEDDLDDLLNSLQEGNDEPQKNDSLDSLILDDFEAPDELDQILEEATIKDEEPKEEALEDNFEDLLKESPIEETLTTEDNLDEILGEAEEEEENELIEESIDSILDDSQEQKDSSEGEVLEDIGDIEILPMAEIESALEEEEETLELNSSEAGNLASILSKLLNNKTIEITIKIKD